MTAVGDPIAIALRVAAAIEAASGAYFIGGSVASSLQGDPRSTNDIDIVVSLAANKVDALAEMLGPDFEVDRDMLRNALLHATSANAFFLPLLTKIDFFGVGRSEFDESEFARRRPVVVGAGGETLVVKTPEDSVLRKLLWFREGGSVSDKQWRDIVAILRVSRLQLDVEYLTLWSRRLGVADDLARAEADSAPRSP
jgi:hypothetical protein